jgi:hypothetical protein
MQHVSWLQAWFLENDRQWTTDLPSTVLLEDVFNLSISLVFDAYLAIVDEGKFQGMAQ